MKDIKTIEIKKGIHLHFVRTDKFKTNYLGFSFHRPLSFEEATVNSLLANVLTRRCPKYPDTASLQRRLEELYGTELNAGVKKKGDMQLVCLTFEFANEAFVGSKQPVFDEVCDLAQEIVFEQQSFSLDYVQQEKENLKNQILAQINDKREYAQIRLVEEMCKEEPYGVMELGNVEELSKVEGEILYQHYQNVLLKSALDIFIIGNMEEEKVIQRVEKMVASQEGYSQSLFHSIVVKDVADVKQIIQKEQINQAKLAMGFRTKTEVTDGDYTALFVGNAVFGGGPYSKLFNNVREKMSLAYYVYSRLDKLKGIMVVNSGIEKNNYQIAYDGIMEQLEAVKNGNFSEQELTAAKLGTVNAIRSIGDNQRQMEDFYITQLLSGKDESIQEFADAIMNIKTEQVMQAVQKIQLDTVYFLTGNE